MAAAPRTRQLAADSPERSASRARARPKSWRVLGIFGRVMKKGSLVGKTP